MLCLLAKRSKYQNRTRTVSNTQLALMDNFLNVFFQHKITNTSGARDEMTYLLEHNSLKIIYIKQPAG